MELAGKRSVIERQLHKRRLPRKSYTQKRIDHEAEEISMVENVHSNKLNTDHILKHKKFRSEKLPSNDEFQ